VKNLEVLIDVGSVGAYLGLDSIHPGRLEGTGREDKDCIHHSRQAVGNRKVVEQIAGSLFEVQLHHLAWALRKIVVPERVDLQIIDCNRLHSLRNMILVLRNIHLKLVCTLLGVVLGFYKWWWGER